MNSEEEGVGGERKKSPETPLTHSLHSPLDFSNSPIGGCSMVVIGDHIPHHTQDSCPVIFPPINHEGVFQREQDNTDRRCQHNQPPASPPLPLPSVSPSQFPLSSPNSCIYDPNKNASLVAPSPPQRPFRDLAHVTRCLRLVIEILCHKINDIASSWRNFFTTNGSGILWAFNSASGVLAAATLFVLLYFRFRGRQRRLQMRERRIDHLLVLIKEKDQKIDQLLHQITQTNEVLQAIHRVWSSRTAN